MNRWSGWRGLGAALVAVTGLTAVADFLFWDVLPGLSWAIFVIIVAATLWLVQGRGRKPWIAWGLLAGAAVQSAIAIGFSNVLVELVLLIYLASEWFVPGFVGRWSRWMEMVWALVKAPFRWLWLATELLYDPVETAGVATRRAWQLALIVLPAAAVALGFAVLLGSGNAILGHWLMEIPERFFRWLWEAISFLRLLSWVFYATLFLALVRPAGPGDKKRPWLIDWQRGAQPGDLVVARWRGYLILLVVNALFFAANGIDAIYLWEQLTLPHSVTLSEYVHQGVTALIASTIFAGVVLVLIHQQNDAAVTNWTRGLSYLWIAQNGVLLIGVLRRLRLYVESYQLTEARVNVGLFLALIACGFALLAVYIHKRESFWWLFARGIAAILLLFYALQFVDTARFVASYNVAAWQANPARGIDVDYLRELGPSAWPALQEVALSGGPQAGLVVDRLREAQLAADSHDNWRSWQARYVLAARECERIAAQRVSSSTPLPEDAPR